MTKQEKNLLNQLERQFSNLDTLPLSAIDPLKNIMKKAPPEALKAIISRKVRFCDTMAVSELIRRGTLDEVARYNHVADVLTRKEMI